MKVSGARAAALSGSVLSRSAGQAIAEVLVRAHREEDDRRAVGARPRNEESATWAEWRITAVGPPLSAVR